MKALELALKLIRHFEGCRLNAYRDIVGVPTICYGSTKSVEMGQSKTLSECEALLSHEAAAFMIRVLQLCPPLATDPNKLAACTSFAYNLGLGAFKASTMRKKILRGEDASDEFKKWNKAGGKAVRGLTIRREMERKVFLGM